MSFTDPNTSHQSQETLTYPLASDKPQELPELWFCHWRHGHVITATLSPTENCCKNPMRQGTWKFFGKTLQVGLYHVHQAHVIS